MSEKKVYVKPEIREIASMRVESALEALLKCHSTLLEIEEGEEADVVDVAIRALRAVREETTPDLVRAAYAVRVACDKSLVRLEVRFAVQERVDGRLHRERSDIDMGALHKLQRLEASKMGVDPETLVPTLGPLDLVLVDAPGEVHKPYLHRSVRFAPSSSSHAEYALVHHVEIVNLTDPFGVVPLKLSADVTRAKIALRTSTSDHLFEAYLTRCEVRPFGFVQPTDGEST